MLHPVTRNGLFVCLLFLSARNVVAQDADAAPKVAQEVHHSLKGVKAKPAEWEFYGASPGKFVTFEPEGLRIKIPKGFRGPPPEYQGQRPRTGVAFGLLAKGDFEVTLRYELLEDLGAPPEGGANRVTLEAILGGAGKNVATIGRASGAGTGQSINAWMKIGLNTQRPFPTRAQSGRLRMVREGQTFSYLAAEGDANFKRLLSVPAVGEDLIDVRVVGTTGAESEILDVCVSDLIVRAASIQGIRTVPIVKQGDAALGQPPALSNGRRVWIGGGIALILALALGLVLILRQKRAATNRESTSAAAAAFVAFPCICGKLLKAKLASMGSDVKCPDCGQTVSVPK